jgi:hypothetical protein
MAALQQLQQGSVSDAVAIAACHCPAVLEVGPGNQQPQCIRHLCLRAGVLLYTCIMTNV